MIHRDCPVQLQPSISMIRQIWAFQLSLLGTEAKPGVVKDEINNFQMPKSARSACQWAARQPGRPAQRFQGQKEFKNMTVHGKNSNYLEQ